MATGEARKLTDNEGINDERPTWSPDSLHVAFLSGPRSSREAWVVPVDGGDPIRVSERAVSILHWSRPPTQD